MSRTRTNAGTQTHDRMYTHARIMHAHTSKHSMLRKQHTHDSKESCRKSAGDEQRSLIMKLAAVFPLRWVYRNRQAHAFERQR